MNAEVFKIDCGDSGCQFKERGPGGMRTNGGCLCLRGAHPDFRAEIFKRIKGYKTLQEEIEALTHEGRQGELEQANVRLADEVRRVQEEADTYHQSEKITFGKAVLTQQKLTIALEALNSLYDNEKVVCGTRNFCLTVINKIEDVT